MDGLFVVSALSNSFSRSITLNFYSRSETSTSLGGIFFILKEVRVKKRGNIVLTLFYLLINFHICSTNIYQSV